MINVKVKCFSQVKYALGVDVLTFEVDENTTSIDLEKIIRERAGEKLNDVSLRIAINQKYQKEEIALQDGDEVVCASRTPSTQFFRSSATAGNQLISFCFVFECLSDFKKPFRNDYNGLQRKTVDPQTPRTA